ncbi:hypothetical protein Tco_0089099 [Tanacetum coccineum]
MNKPVRLLLLKPEKSGRMAKWAIELGEHKIEYKQMNAIKAQVLADFLAETQEEDEEIDFQSHEEKGKNTGRRKQVRIDDDDVVGFLAWIQALGRHLEKIHVTWAQFWKEPDKMTIWLEDRLKNQDQSVETASGKLVMPSESHSDDVWKSVTPSESSVIKEALETLA